MIRRRVEDVFVTAGVPEFTFVAPPNYGEILVDVRSAGTPVIIEGQSGTGKTTCVRKILEQIHADRPAIYLSARQPVDVATITELVNNPNQSTYVIDDFHRLPTGLRAALANLAKMAAEQATPNPLPKLVLIGINQVGSELIQLVPDIAKRTGIHRIKPGDKNRIFQLIDAGSKELNVTIREKATIFEECGGDYWLAQQLSQTICTMNGVFETQDESVALQFEPAVLRDKVVDRLANAYYPAVKEFCRGRRFRPTNDPYYKLLRTVAREASAVVDLDMLANRYEDVRGSINNIKEDRLAALLQSKEQCAKHFYYNPETKNFAVEDPALTYFLKHLDWDELRIDCGFRQESRDYEFDIALSFAGENRELARFLAEQFTILDVRVFYDAYFEANFLGRTWSAEFERIFARTSRLVVCVLDSNYRAKIWPTFEKECFEPRIPEGAVIPILLDETVFPGIPKDIVGIRYSWDSEDPKWKDVATDTVVFKVMERLG